MTDPFAALLYGSLPYQYPLIDNQPVIRVPVAGPEPYNTLALVRGVKSTTGVLDPGTGDVYRHTIITTTNFSLVGFDPRVGTPPPQHSTMVSLEVVEATTDCEFLTATDLVTAYFDATGTWTVQTEVAGQADDGAFFDSACHFSSWVLCYEPPVTLPPGAGRWRYTGEQIPNRHFVLPLPPRPGDRRKRAPARCDYGYAGPGGDTDRWGVDDGK